MAIANIYLTFNGNCEEAFLFYQSVLGGEIPYIGRFNEMPAEGGKTLSPEEGDRIMHMSLALDPNTTLMGSDTGGEWAMHYKPGNNFSISLNASSKEEADKWFAGLSAGGRANMPMDSTFWGSYFGMLEDRFGINWMISFEQGK